MENNSINSQLRTLGTALQGLRSERKASEINVEGLQAKIKEVKNASKPIFEAYSKGEETNITHALQKLKKEVKSIKDNLQSSKDGVVKETFKALSSEEKTELLSTLTPLEEAVYDLEEFKMVVSHFETKSSFPGKLSHIKEQFIEYFFSSITERIRSNIYLGYKPNQKLAYLEKKKAQLDKEIEVKEKKGSLQEKDIQALKEKRSTVEASLEKLYEKKEKGLETRRLFKTLGGEAVKLHHTDENITLDAAFISSDDFRSTLKRAGAQKFTLSLGDDVFSGIAFSQDDMENNDLKEQLNSIGLFGKGDIVPKESEESKRLGVGFNKIYHNEHVLIVSEAELQKLNKLKLLDENNKIIETERSLNVAFEEWDLSKPSNGGTVLLTSGNNGVYEMHKTELFAYLMRGMNVMALNFRGYGESTGKPTPKGLNQDMEAAYQFLKSKDIPDEKIVLKALCMSGGPAAHLASNHPEVNLFLDQTYADFSDIVNDEMNAVVDDYLENQSPIKDKETLLAWVKEHKNAITHVVSKLIAPSWSVRKDIGKVKGHVGFMLSSDDDLMTIDRDVYENYKKAASTRNAKSISIYEFEGEHGDSWVKSVSDIYPIFANETKIKKLSYDIRSQSKSTVKNYDKFSVKRNSFLTSLAEEISNKTLLEVEELMKMQEKLVKNLNSIIEDHPEKGVTNKDIKIQISKITKTIIDPTEREACQAFLEKSFVRKNALISLFEKIKKNQQEKNYSLPELKDEIELRLSNLGYPEATRNEFEIFLNKAINLELAESLDDPKFLQKQNKGHVQMDAFLQKAKLSDPFIA